MFIGDLMYSGGLGQLGFTSGIEEINEDTARKTFDGASYFTDGIRAVMFFVTRPRAISDVEFLEWYPLMKIREKNAAIRHQAGAVQVD